MAAGRAGLRRQGFARAEGGAAAIEFALVLPLLLLLVFGAFQAGEAVSAYRKVTLTATTVANLASQYTSMSASDVSTVMNASTQVMAPFPAASVSIVLSEFTTDASGKTTVTWSQTLNGTALTPNAVTTLPAGVAQPGTSLILATATYSYAPPIRYFFNRPFPMTSQTYMFPRSTQSIPYTGS